VLLYSNANSSTAFKILNDYLRSEKLVKSKIVEHLSKLQIAEDFVIEQGNGAYQINLLKQNSWVPLAEMGFGISKIFFFLLTLSAYKLVFIEEPESNLHPDLQSKLADILQSFSGSNTKFIIETHSEYLIRKLQYLVAINKIKKEDVLIHYFPSASNRQQSTQIKTIRIKRDGGIDGDFGAGFFDEAANIIKDLFNLTYYN
jgi:predicted ATPase